MRRAAPDDGPSLLKANVIGPVGAAVEKGASAVDLFDDVARSQNPAQAPAGVAPVLREAIDDYDRVGIHVFNVLGRRDHPCLGRSVDIVGIEFVENEGALTLAGKVDPGLELFAFNQLTTRPERCR